MLRLNACADFFLPIHFRAWIITNIVVVFTPPPVDPGEAPMNIRIHIAKRPALEKFPMLYVENPAVLVVILWKNAPIHVIFSVAFKIRVPPIKRTAVIEMATLECRQSFLKLFCFTISTSTRNPIPPTITKTSVVIFSRILSL